ncbi:butyrophilin subfamily 3 member A2-like [Seriola aureovittata]|uniref:butyrophilin subfamily 3 member A2-like n=1 Tax=Seriola aureovittata TaxID=2871759 RepID=UPI0024BE72DB|nr:butyrophilin subfamily 3 member A2-like [Seriola aureovittata]
MKNAQKDKEKEDVVKTLMEVKAELENQKGQTQVYPPQPVVVMVGDDTVLPCQLEPAMDAFKMTMEWGRLDLDPRFIYVWHDGKALLDDQNTAYKGRTSLSIDKLKHGDISLKLSKVKVSDHGTYRCYIPKQNKRYLVELHVAAISSPGVSLARLHKDSGRVVLQCESKGWHPEPELLWLDGEGKLLSAGPTETVRGPDDLYTVSSRVTVEKRHSNNFTCRVQQKIINQTRETHFYIPDDFFMATSNCAASISFSVVFCLMFVVAVSFSVWRQNRIKMPCRDMNEDQEEKTTATNTSTEHQPLMARKEINKMDKKRAKLDEHLKEKEEEQKDVVQIIDCLMELTKELETQKEQLTVQMQKAEREVEETDNKVTSVEIEVTEEEGDKIANKAKGYLKLKEIILESNNNQQERKQEYQQLQMNVDKIVKKVVFEEYLEIRFQPITVFVCQTSS